MDEAHDGLNRGMGHGVPQEVNLTDKEEAALRAAETRRNRIRGILEDVPDTL